MSTRLGIDLGTTFSSAATSVDGAVEIIDIDDGPVTPSVVAFDGDTVLTGRAAERRLADSPASGVREFKRRLGDTTPFILDGVPHGAEALTGHLIRAVIDQLPASPDVVCVTHPANWGEYKLELLRDAARLAGVGDIELMSEPAAAALHHAAARALPVGSTVAVYDFGGGTFDAAVVRITDDGADVLGRPEGLERLGGVDIDQIVLAHVDESLDGALRDADTANPEVRAAIAELRRECTSAKEALSADTDVNIAVRLPGLSTEVRMTRTELEAALNARIDDTLASLDRALASAGVTADDLTAVILVGGSAAVPAVAERVAAHTGAEVMAGADQLTAVAAGAARGTIGSSPMAAAASGADDADAGDTGERREPDEKSGAAKGPAATASRGRSRGARRAPPSRICPRSPATSRRPPRAPTRSSAPTSTARPCTRGASRASDRATAPRWRTRSCASRTRSATRSSSSPRGSTRT